MDQQAAYQHGVKEGLTPEERDGRQRDFMAKVAWASGSTGAVNIQDNWYGTPRKVTLLMWSNH
jgi:hypothetical protein